MPYRMQTRLRLHGAEGESGSGGKVAIAFFVGAVVGFFVGGAVVGAGDYDVDRMSEDYLRRNRG